MRKIWVAVANRSEMKLYLAENVDTLVEINTLTHYEGQKTTHELVSDKQGYHRGTQTGDTMDEKTPTKIKEATAFANQITKVLENGIKTERIERIYLIASPEFLGILRQHLSPQVKDCIEKEIDKDVVHSTSKQIRDYLPPVL